MKKAGVYATVLLITACFSFLLGFLTGQSMRRTPIIETPVTPATTSLPSVTDTPEIPAGKLDVNTATVKQLAALPGIGEVLAGRIVAYRDANGPFRELNELRNVAGIGYQKLTAIWDYICIGG